MSVTHHLIYFTKCSLYQLQWLSLDNQYRTTGSVCAFIYIEQVTVKINFTYHYTYFK